MSEPPRPSPRRITNKRERELMASGLFPQWIIEKWPDVEILSRKEKTDRTKAINAAWETLVETPRQKLAKEGVPYEGCSEQEANRIKRRAMGIVVQTSKLDRWRLQGLKEHHADYRPPTPEHVIERERREREFRQSLPEVEAAAKEAAHRPDIQQQGERDAKIFDRHFRNHDYANQDFFANTADDDKYEIMAGGNPFDYDEI